MESTHQLSKHAHVIQELLSKHNLNTSVVEFPASTRTAQEAATVIGCTVAEIAKSLIFKTAVTNRPILIIASGVNRVNEKRIEALVQEKIVKADADFVKEITGFAIGGVAPFGHTHKIGFIFIDPSLLQFNTVWAAAGTPNSVFNIPTATLINISSGTVTSIT